MNCEICGTVLQISQFRICSMPCYGAMWACAGEKIPFYEPIQPKLYLDGAMWACADERIPLYEPSQKLPQDEWESMSDLQWEQMWKLGWYSGKPKRDKYPPEFDLDLKKQIRKREGNRCFLCGSSKTLQGLPVHHIDYNKTNSNESNLVALCEKCHPKTNGNRDYWQKHITDLMETAYGYSYEREKQNA